jgi:hypothetical protein
MTVMPLQGRSGSAPRARRNAVVSACSGPPVWTWPSCSASMAWRSRVHPGVSGVQFIRVLVQVRPEVGGSKLVSPFPACSQMLSKLGAAMLQQVAEQVERVRL